MSPGLKLTRCFKILQIKLIIQQFGNEKIDQLDQLNIKSKQFSLKTTNKTVTRFFQEGRSKLK